MWSWIQRIATKYTTVDESLAGIPYISCDPTIIPDCHDLCYNILPGVAPAIMSYIKLSVAPNTPEPTKSLDQKNHPLPPPPPTPPTLSLLPLTVAPTTTTDTIPAFVWRHHLKKVISLCNVISELALPHI